MSLIDIGRDGRVLARAAVRGVRDARAWLARSVHARFVKLADYLEKLAKSNELAEKSKSNELAEKSNTLIELEKSINEIKGQLAVLASEKASSEKPTPVTKPIIPKPVTAAQNKQTKHNDKKQGVSNQKGGRGNNKHVWVLLSSLKNR